MSRVLTLLVAVALLAACSAAPLSEDAAEQLQQHTAAVRDAAEAEDTEAAMHALEVLRDALATHRAAGGITEDRAREIAAAADEVAALLVAAPAADEPTPTPTVEASPTAEPTPPPPPPPPSPAPEGDRDDGQDGGEDGDGQTDDDDENGDDDQKDGGEDGDRQTDDEDGEGGEGPRGPDGQGPPGQR